MEMPLAENGSGAPDAPFPFDEVEFGVSDLHLGAGRFLRVRASRGPWRWLQRMWLKARSKEGGEAETVEVPNPMEDFEADDIFASFLEKMVATYGRARKLNCHLLGDCWDPLAVTWKGRSDDPDYEAVAAYKMRQIISGHPRFFAALRRFLHQPNGEVFIYTGNHDQCNDSHMVQRVILRALCGRDPELRAKVHFVDRAVQHQRIHRGVRWYHGMNCEPHNTIDPENSIITERFGRKLKHTLINKPLGSDITVRLVNRLKLFNAHIGRMRYEGHIWGYASRFRWMWALWAGVAVTWYLFTQQVMVFWDFRDHTGLLALLRMMFGKMLATFRAMKTTTATGKDHPVNVTARKWLLDNPGVARVTIDGHSHQPCRETDENGTHLNCGTWIRKVKLLYPVFRNTWRRCRWLETAVLTLKHFFVTGRIPFGRQVAKVLGLAVMITSLFWFLFTNYRDGERLLSFDVGTLKIAAGIMVSLSIILGLIRIFSVRPAEVDDTRYTFALVRHGTDGNLTADLKEYFPEEDAVRDYV